MNINFTQKEEEIITDAAQLLLYIIENNNLVDKYQKEIKRINEISWRNYQNTSICPSELYLICNYLNLYIHFGGLSNGKTDKDIEDIIHDRDIKIASKLNNKIRYMLNTHLVDEIIYLDYDKNVQEITNDKNKIILEKLGNNIQTIKLYPTIKKKLQNMYCNISEIVSSEKGMILQPQYAEFIIYQKEIS